MIAGSSAETHLRMMTDPERGRFYREYWWLRVMDAEHPARAEEEALARTLGIADCDLRLAVVEAPGPDRVTAEGERKWLRERLAGGR